MKKLILYSFLFASYSLIYSCKDENKGCLDVFATNYSIDADVDDNTCCYTCFTEIDTLGEYCGNEMSDLIFNGFVYDSLHFWVLNGAFVLPNTPDAIPAFDENDEPIKMMYEASVNCN